MTKNPSSFERFELRNVPGDKADEALYEALSDPAEMVRLNAQQSLYAKHGLEALAQPLQNRLNALSLSLWSALPGVRDAAISELRRILSGLHGGKTPQELGLVYSGDPRAPELRRFLDSYHAAAGAPGPWAERLDVAALRPLAGDDRFWAVQMLVKAAEGASWSAPDLRAIRAMRELCWR